MRITDCREVESVGTLGDDHNLSRRARAYGERVVRDTDWALADVNCAKITWETSTRAKRRHGRCSYDGGGHVTITLTEHTYERAGFEACKTTIRHELVHAWQYQHRGERAVVTNTEIQLQADGDRTASNHTHSDHADTVTAATESTPDADVFTVDTGHGNSFRAWVDPLDLPGRCSTYYDRRRSDFAYVYACPNCGEWWGKHRLCKSVRQAAHGGKGSTGYRYCTDCEVLLHLQTDEWYLAHDDHDDASIKAFVDGEFESAADSELPLVHSREITATKRPE